MRRPDLPDPLRARLRDAAERLGVSDRAQAAWRAFEPEWITQDRRDNEHLRAMLAAMLAPEANCIDIGAFEGELLADLVRLAPHGSHIAYEPLPAQHAALCRRFPRVDVRQAAVSDRTGRASFVHPVNLPGWSGLRETDYPQEPELERLDVALECLDENLPDGYVPAFIKIDANGAELDVLSGARRTICTHRPAIAFEHGLGAANRYDARPEAIFELLVGDADLRIFDLDGDGPYSEARFVQAFERHERVNFLARP